MQKKYKKLLTTAATATLVATAIVPAVSAASFSDTAGNTHELAIEALVGQGIISGYPDGTFKPNKTLTRSDVVKLLGKYLVSQGFKVPSDYKTKMRFNDLRSTSQDELLQYAALVKDNGVFNGSSGNLLPNDPITRENMAVVLVRAYSNINNFDFLDYVLHQDFDEDVTDYNAAKAEARSAIKVLDYFNITGVTQFNPKGFTTRGQFSSFLYKTLQVDVPGASLKTVEVVDASTLKVTLDDNTTHTVKLAKALEDGKETTVEFKINGKTYTTKVTYEATLTVKSAEVTGANKLKVTLSNDKVHEVTLAKDLPENEETTVTFKIDGKDYSAKVTYVVTAVKVASVKAVNGGQIEIKFNQKVNLPEHLNQTQLANYVTVTGVDAGGAVAFKHGYLSADGRTLTVVTDGSVPLAGRYVVKVKDVKNAAGTTVTAYDEILNFGTDTTAPTLVSTTNVDAKTVRVTFSEPLRQFNNAAISFKLANGSIVTGITGQIGQGEWYADFDLTNAKVNGQPVAANTAITATFAGLRDIAGNFTSPNPTATSFAIGGADGVKPTLAAVAQTGPKTFKLTFSERIQKPAPTDLEVKLGTSPSNPITAIDAVAGDTRSFNVTVANDLNGVYNIGTALGKVITDISGETNTFAITHAFSLDTAAPVVDSTAVTRVGNDEYLEITLNKAVNVVAGSRVTATGNYVKSGVTHTFTGAPATVQYKSNDNKAVLRVKLADLLSPNGATDATYNVTLAFTDVKSLYNVNTANKAVTFQRTSDYAFNNNVLTAPTVTTTSSDSAAANTQVKLVFNHDVDATTAIVASNYKIEGATVLNAQVLQGALNTVVLTLKQGDTVSSGLRYLDITGVKAKNSVATQPNLRAEVTLNENVTPKAVSATFKSANTIEVTFSENVTGLDNTAFAVELASGGTVTVSAVSQLEPTKATITLSAPLAAATTVKVKKGATSGNVKDGVGNVLDSNFLLDATLYTN